MAQSADQRLLEAWGAADLPAPRDQAQLERELQRLEGVEARLRHLCACARAGDAEAVAKTLEAPGFEAPAFRVLHAALLTKLARGNEASEVVEPLQQSRLVAAKVLCATVTFGWNEKATALDMLHKTLLALGGEEEDGGVGATAGARGDRAPLLDLLGKPLTHAAVEHWRARVTALLVSCYARSGEYALAIDLCDNAEKNCPAAARAAVLLQHARLRLQIGDLEIAKTLVQRARCREGLTERDALACDAVHGMALYAESRYEQAQEVFEKMRVTAVRVAALAPKSKDMSLDDLLHEAVDLHVDTQASIANNLALCHLNLCDLDRAIATLEQCVRDNPRDNLQRAVVFNLCALYDLAKPKAQSQHAKEALRRLAQLLGLRDRFDDQADLRLY